MRSIPPIVPRWFPAFVMMLVIFAFSSRPGDSLPDFLDWDYLIKKSGHVIGYGLLALSYLHLLRNSPRKYWVAWLLAILYGAADEFHQSFIPGRYASVLDVMIFDNLGAVIALLLDLRIWRTADRKRQPN